MGTKTNPSPTSFFLFNIALTFKYRQLGVDLAYAKFYFAINQSFVVVLIGLMMGKSEAHFYFLQIYTSL
jgi:hypothetical protein